MEITEVIKRDFTTKTFHLHKITNAILKAMTAVEHGGPADAEEISQNVYTALLERKQADAVYKPTVEEVQDFVENNVTLRGGGYFYLTRGPVSENIPKSL